MQINKTCSICGASITAEQEQVTEAMQEHRNAHVKDLQEQITALQDKITEIEKIEE